MSFDRTESAQWALTAGQAAAELEGAVDHAFSEAAGRGFPAPPGHSLEAVLLLGQAAKGKLVEANARIYEEQRQTLFQQEEFALLVVVRLAKLALESYREQIFNALALEQAEAQGMTERSRADVDRANTEVEARQAAIIRARAETESRINSYRAQLVSAEMVTLDSERSLIQAQMATAEKKLEIIKSIYQVLAAEELVLAAERRRADSLERVLEAQRMVAGIKQATVPYLIEKAVAREELAEAVTREAATLEALERLGYDRANLKTVEEYVNHQIREAEEKYEVAKVARIRANKATEVARTEARRILQDYANVIRAQILEVRKDLEKQGVVLRIETQSVRHADSMNADISVLSQERINLGLELANLIVNMGNQAMDSERTIRDSAVKLMLSASVKATTRKQIQKG